MFIDIDVVSSARNAGYTASDEELKQSLLAARLISRQDGLALSSTICCSGNGHYVIAPLVAITVNDDEIARKFKLFCQHLVDVGHNIDGIKIDPVFNSSRVMRLMSTSNRKGITAQGRSHRRAYWQTKPLCTPSMDLHFMLLATEAERINSSIRQIPRGIRCDLTKLEKCRFIQWCRRYPSLVSEPQWFGLIANLACLEGGIRLIHEISALDHTRYDAQTTEYVISRVLDAGYKPTACENLNCRVPNPSNKGGFCCALMDHCPARAPMYLATLHTIYEREKS